MSVESLSELASQIEALLIVATEPVSAQTIAQITGAEPALITDAVAEIEQHFAHHGFVVRHINGGWQFATHPRHDDLIRRWVVEGQKNRLSQAALETLAVIAYAGPISRSRISAIRGVNVDGVVRTLLARGLIAQAGSDETSGAGLLITTGYFLERMGLASLDDLPPIAPHLPDASELEKELAGLGGFEAVRSQPAPSHDLKENDA